MEKEINRTGKGKQREYLRLILVLVILFGIAGAFIIYLAWPLLTGESVILATTPIDPFDLLRGQYITINYEINRIPIIEGAEAGESVYVVLEKDNSDIWRYKKALLVKPEQGRFIKGKIISISGKTMNIEYGIEQYFFERGAQIPQQNLTVEVRLSSLGQGRIVQLLQNGEAVKIEYRDRGD